MLLFKYSFHSFDNKQLVDLYARFFPKLNQSLVNLIGFFGFSSGNSLLSARGMFSTIAIIGTIVLFWTTFKSLCQTTAQNESINKPIEHQFMIVFFIISVIFNIFVFIIVDEDITGRYFIPFMVLYIPLVAILFEYTEKSFGNLKHMAVVSGIVLFIFAQSYLNFQNIAMHDINSIRKSHIQYLLDNRLNFGFATFWNANVTTELTNGKIEFVVLNPDINQFHIHNWLSPIKHPNSTNHLEESFLLLSRVEWEQVQAAKLSFSQIQPDYKDSNFIIIRYPSAEIIHLEVLDN